MAFPQGQPVSGYGAGFFRVGKQVIRGAMLVHPKGAQAWGGYEDTAPLQALRGSVDLLLLGTGTKGRPAPQDICQMMAAADIRVEAMPSLSACRSYNVLLAEERRVAAAVLAL